MGNCRRRSPYGERGLKSIDIVDDAPMVGSLPVWGAWIEISTIIKPDRGAYGRSPYGERGLKFSDMRATAAYEPSLPVWGAWIEIESARLCIRRRPVAPRMGSVD